MNDEKNNNWHKSIDTNYTKNKKKEKKKKNEKNKIENRISKTLKSLRVKLFMVLSGTILLIIIFLVVLNTFVLEEFYVYQKTEVLKEVYYHVERYYEEEGDTDLEEELENIAIKNDFDILIQNHSKTNIFISNGEGESAGLGINQSINGFNAQDVEIVEKIEEYDIIKFEDANNGFIYIALYAELDNGYSLTIKMPLNSIHESVLIANNFLLIVAGITIVVAGIIISIVSKKFTDPILELSDIAKKMSNLDFSKKYNVKKQNDEINDLGKSINMMSNKLENTIMQLKTTNFELEKDIEEKYKIDEMRKTFISDVSHELKTPIALIQAYGEGLVENVNTDEESRKFYAEVILDEASKMDKLVKKLLELMKLEYGKREFDDRKFNLVELQKEVIRKSKVLLEENNIEIKINSENIINVYADDFYIEQVFTNYFTNAIKHVKEINGKKIIKLENIIDTKTNNVRIEVSNTGINIQEEDLKKIWERFYKVDESRNRNDGGIGIGLALVKAILNNYKKDFGAKNIKDGVMFYFELEIKNDKLIEKN